MNSTPDGGALHVDLRGGLVDALREEIKREVVEGIREQLREELKKEFQVQLEELKSNFKTQPHVSFPMSIAAPHQSDAPAVASERKSKPRSRRLSVFDVNENVSWAASLIMQATGHTEARSEGVTPIVLFSDLGGAAYDCGDTVALFLMRGLEGLGFIEVKAVLISTHSARSLETSAKTAT